MHHACTINTIIVAIVVCVYCFFLFYYYFFFFGEKAIIHFTRLSLYLSRSTLSFTSSFSNNDYSTIKIVWPEQFVPFPEYPTLHAQLKEPMLLEQEACGSQLWAFQLHSSKSERKRNTKYIMMRLPFLLLCYRRFSSFPPEQVTPSPVYPALQVHLKDAMLLWQAAFESQLCEFAVHSSRSRKEIANWIITCFFLRTHFLIRLKVHAKLHTQRDTRMAPVFAQLN